MGEKKSIILGHQTKTQMSNNQKLTAMKTTIKEAYKEAKKDKTQAWVTFKDIEEPKENQVWIIDCYNPAYKEYILINWMDSSREKYCKGDKVCFNDFIF